MAGQSVNFDFTSTGADRLGADFRKVGGNAELAAKGARALKDALDKQQGTAPKTAAEMTALTRAVRLFGDAEDKAALKALAADAAIRGLGDASQKAGRQAAAGAAGVSALAGTGGIPGGGLGALIAGGVALSPVIATLGTGLAGLAAAAVSTVGPILKAGTATKEAQKALASLDPAQKAAYDSLGLLKTQFGGFAKSLEPQVLDVFSGALKIASGLMADVQPVAKATGDALGGFLGQIDAEFRSRTWQDFFGFMAKEAGPDMQLVAGAILPLLDTLPKLLTDIQPIAVQFLQAAGGAARLADAAVTLNDKIQHLGTASGQSGGLLGRLADAGKKAVAQMLPGIPAAQALGKWLGVVGGNSDKAASGTGKAGDAFKGATPHAQMYAQWIAQSAKATTALMDAQSAAVSTQLAYGNDILTSANDAQTFHDKLKASKGMIGLHTQAQRDSFGAANTYIGDLARQASGAIASGHGTDAAITAIKNGLPALDTVKTKNKQYWQEVKTLVGWLQQLELIKAINSAIHVSGTGQWSVTPGKIGLPGGTAGGPFAAGGLIRMGTGPTADDVMIRASRGELIVPANMVKAGAVDHLRGRIPGFASGGVAGSYGPAAVGGLPPWGNAELAATQRAIARDTAKSMADAINQAKTQAADPFAGITGVPSGAKISGSAQAAMNFAKSILWAYGWGQNQFPPLRDLWMGECLTLDAVILTRRGWLTWDEVRAGEDETIGYNPATGRSEWTPVLRVVHYDDAEVWRIGGPRWHADVTPGHRWWSDSRKNNGRGHVHEHSGFVRTDEFAYGDRLRLAAPADTDGIPGLSTDDAAILAWIQGDGHIQRRDGRIEGARIYQSKPAQITRLRALLAHTEHTEACYRQDKGQPEHVFLLRSGYTRDLLKRSGVDEDGPEQMVLRMSPDQRAAWLTAMIDAEGHSVGGYIMVSQNEGELARAIQLAIYLEGHRPNVRPEERKPRNKLVMGLGNPHVAVHRFGPREMLDRQPVWCVTTGLGTWTAKQGNQVFLTGNSGWNYLAYNASSGATGIPQSLPGSKMASAGADWRTNPATQIRWGLGYIKQVYGSPANAYGRWLGRSPHWYSQGGLVPGFASGGTVGQQGAAWLKAWQTRHGGGFGAAHGPVVVNEQIARMAAAAGRAKALAGAPGLSPGQHRFWAGAADDETRRLGVLHKELATERAWRFQLGVNELGLDREVRAAGNLPGLAGPVRGWKAQIGRDRATIAGVSRMLGYSGAYLAAHKPPPKVTPPGVPGSIPHTGAYTDSTADLIAQLFAASASLSRVVTLDSGGWLMPGVHVVANKTGRPEQVLPAGRGGSGGGGTIVLNNHGIIGSQAELENWLVRSIDDLKRKRRI